MVGKGYELSFKCFICENAQDSMDHILWKCAFSINIWRWLCSVFRFSHAKSFDDIWNSAKNKSPLIKEAWITAACSVIKELEFQKIKDCLNKSSQILKIIIKKTVFEGAFKMKGNNWNQNYDLRVISFFNLGPRHNKFQCIKACYWSPPPIGYTLFCCDGFSFGNPGVAGFGIVVRNHSCQVIGVLSGGIGITNNYVAEVYAVVCAVELAGECKSHHIILSSDSRTVITDFSKGQVPWFIRMRWLRVVSKVASVLFKHCFREVKFSADMWLKKEQV
ncbi:uncharacterized protein LOC113349360 [Papaver somniferum]|uniref:uncharacterized protein LOC113349360 n=1 Tax=Papaver somniferum TaxID=3469 RepID=UPI000E6F8676|nr:uncharacterized protein LOC113349360 [Papaver somniferum]